MVVRDGIYGAFTVPAYLANLVLTPEVYRLSQIRLVNTPSPTLPALGDVRRFSHTLGVLYLCQLSRAPEFSEDEWRAFEASVLLHDVGSAPFGHLLEYHLAEHNPGGWSHESMISAVLANNHAPENRAHQIYAKRTVRLRREIRESGIRFEIVEAIVSGNHPLSKLLFGSVDLDNLDNVARMAWAVGISGGGETVTKLATCIRLTRKGQLALGEEIGRSPIRDWLQIRRAVYQILLFDLTAIALQAVLSESIGLLVRDELLDAADWTLTDEQLLDRLLTEPRTKEAMIKEYFGTPPTPVFCFRAEGALDTFGLKTREAAKSLVEEVLNTQLSTNLGLGYVIADRGTLEKRVEFVDPVFNRSWVEGTSTQAIVFYGFVRSGRTVPTDICVRAAKELIARIGCDPLQITHIRFGSEVDLNDDQRTFDFQAEKGRLGLL